MTQLAYSPDGMHIASGGDDGKVCSSKKNASENLNLD